jgi:hypothetical protein
MKGVVVLDSLPTRRNDAAAAVLCLATPTAGARVDKLIYVSKRMLPSNTALATYARPRSLDAARARMSRRALLSVQSACTATMACACAHRSDAPRRRCWCSPQARDNSPLGLRRVVAVVVHGARARRWRASRRRSVSEIDLSTVGQPLLAVGLSEPCNPAPWVSHAASHAGQTSTTDPPETVSASSWTLS